MPGSLASIAGVFLYLIFYKSTFLYIILFAVVTYIGFKVSGPIEEASKEKDPSCIVIDEVSGILLAFFLLPVSVPIIFTAFFLFRAFDMFKLYPVSKFEDLKGGKGVMLDDIFAGLYTNIVMHLAIRFGNIV